MIKNIIFDLGNVLLSFKPLDYVLTKIPDGKKANQVHKAIFQAQEWLLLDRGVIEEKEAINCVCRRNPDFCDFIKLVMNDWYGMLTPMEDVVVYLNKLKGMGYKIYFLSNYQLQAFEYVNKHYSFFADFDGGIVSFREKLLKPEPDIYKKLMETYTIVPEESLFIDDTKENIDAARELGFNTIHFTGSLQLKEDLIGYNIRL